MFDLAAQVRCARLEREFEIRSKNPRTAGSTFETSFAAVESRLVQLGVLQWHRSTDLGKVLYQEFHKIACNPTAGAKRTPMPEDMDLVHAAPGVYMKREEFNSKGNPAWLLAIKQ